MKVCDVMVPLRHQMKSTDGIREFVTVIKILRVSENSPWTKTLPVLDDQGKVIGMLSMTDILKAVFPSYLYTADLSMFTWDGMLESLAKHVTGKTVADFMAKPVITILHDRPLMEGVDHMLKHGISTLPVLDRTGNVLGILYMSDIFFVIASAMPGDSGEAT
jgi:CBS-domain-containing membrane protein